MLSRIFKAKTGSSSKKKRDKEISLTAENDKSKESYTVKIRQSVLAEHSDVFKKMASDGEFKRNRKLKLDDITVLALQKISEYMEKSTASFKNHYEVIETLRGAHKYQLKSIESICADHLITTLDVSNVCEIYEFAGEYSYYDLEYKCLKLIDSMTEAVLQSPGFLTLQKSTVQDIIKRNSLNLDSEMTVFESALSWGLNECFKLGLDPDNSLEFMSVVKSLLGHVRFLTMTKEELTDPRVDKFFTLLTSDEVLNKRLSRQSSRSSTTEPLILQPRLHVKDYIHSLDAYESTQPPVKSGEIFSLRLEVIKGKLFLTSINLALVTFAPTKNTACVSLVLSATNVFTMDQKTARGTFMNTSDVASMDFSTPLAVKESERVEITLQVKRAENISPLVIKNEVQIAMPESKDVALKITPSDTRQETMRCIVKEIVYFF